MKMKEKTELNKFKKEFKKIQDWQRKLLLDAILLRIDLIGEKNYALNTNNLLELTKVKDNILEFEYWEDLKYNSNNDRESMIRIQSLNKALMFFLRKHIKDVYMTTLTIIVFDALNYDEQEDKDMDGERMISNDEGIDIKSILIKKIDSISMLYPEFITGKNKNMLLKEVVNCNSTEDLKSSDIKTINRLLINEFIDKYFNQNLEESDMWENLKMQLRIIAVLSYHKNFYEILKETIIKGEEENDN